MSTVRRSRTLIMLLVGFLVMTGFGIQQIQYQQQQTRIQNQQRTEAHQNTLRDACYEKWGRDVITALDARSVSTVKANTVIGRATDARTTKDDAGDVVFLLLADAVANPSTDPGVNRVRVAQFGTALQTFVAAKHRLVLAERARVKAEAERDRTRNRNPFPRLHCGADISHVSSALAVVALWIRVEGNIDPSP